LLQLAVPTQKMLPASDSLAAGHFTASAL